MVSLAELQQLRGRVEKARKSVEGFRKFKRPGRGLVFRSKGDLERYKSAVRTYKREYGRYKRAYERYRRWVESTARQIRGRGGYVVFRGLSRRSRGGGEAILGLRGTRYTAEGQRIGLVDDDWLTNVRGGTYDEVREGLDVLFGNYGGYNVFFTSDFWKANKKELDQYFRERPGVLKSHPELLPEFRQKGERFDFGTKFNELAWHQRELEKERRKMAFLESPTAVWKSREAYGRAFKGVYGVLPSAEELDYVLVPESREELERRKRFIESADAVWKDVDTFLREAGELSRRGFELDLPEEIRVVKKGRGRRGSRFADYGGDLW
jgi:hypothetical protein